MKLHKLIFWYAMGLHTTWGVLLMLSPQAGWATALHSLGAAVIDHRLMGAVLLSIGLLAGEGLRRYGATFKGLLCVFPQQLAMLISAMGAIEAMALSQFADGVVRPRAFIIADQFPAVLAAALHTMAMMEFYAHGTMKKIGGFLYRLFRRGK